MLKQIVEGMKITEEKLNTDEKKAVNAFHGMLHTYSHTEHGPDGIYLEIDFPELIKDIKKEFPKLSSSEINNVRFELAGNWERIML